MTTGATGDYKLAKTLQDAYRACDLKALTADTIDRYYVPFASRNNAISGVNTKLMVTGPGEFETILFTGHIGCGKSTELAQIARHQQDQFLVVDIQAEYEMDPKDLEYPDLYLTIIKRVEVELRHLGIAFDSKLLNSFETWFKEITEESDESVTRSVNVEAEASLGPTAPFIAKLLVKLMAQVKASSSERRKIRQVLTPEISRLTTDINLLLLDGMEKLRTKYPQKKGILLVIDGLDKCPPPVAKRLFFDYAAQLQALNCVIIYTIPIHTLYEQRGIETAFGYPHIIPMTNVYVPNMDQWDLDYDPDGLNDIARLIEKRVDILATFEHRDVLIKMAEASGGHVRHLMQLMQGACIQALGMGRTQIQMDNVTYAINQQQFLFERSLLRSYYGELARIAQQKSLTDDEVGRELLFSRAVLEYNGVHRWVYPNPVVRQIDLFKKAVADLQSSGQNSAPDSSSTPDSQTP